MASELRVDTLKDSSGNNSVGMTYVAGGTSKSWASFDLSGTAHIDESLNTSSLTDNQTGDSTIAFTSNMNTTTYCVSIAGDYDTGSQMANGIWLPSNLNRTASSLRTRCTNDGGTSNDNPVACWTIMGDLA
jgi:hypothetical protein